MVRMTGYLMYLTQGIWTRLGMAGDASQGVERTPAGESWNRGMCPEVPGSFTTFDIVIIIAIAIHHLHSPLASAIRCLPIAYHQGARITICAHLRLMCEAAASL